MTAQRGDIYKHNGREYTLIALSSNLPFDPRNFALEPHTRSTACYSDIAKQQRELIKQLKSDPNVLDNCDISSFIKDTYFTKPKLFDYVY